MPYTVDKAEQLEDAHNKGYAALKASLQRSGAETRQHNVGVKKTSKKSAAKKASAKKVSAKPVKKSAAKKSSATPVKKTVANKKS